MIVRGTQRTMLALALVAVFAVAATHVPSAAAFERQNVVCELEELTRYISLRIDPEAGYVCDVLYEKPDEGDAREVLWSARNDKSFCEPRFIDLVEDLAARGWTCGPVEEPDEPAEQPLIGAAEGGQPVDDATDAAARLREWCVADMTSGEGGEGPGSLEDYCACVVDDMVSNGLSDEDVTLMVDGLPSRSAEEAEGDPPSPSERDKRLNTLAVNYDYALESCR